MTSLKVETSTGSVLDKTGEDWRFYRSSLERFGGDEILTILVVGKYAFDVEALEAVARLTSEFEGIEGVERVDSLASVPLVRATPQGDVLLGAALSDGVPDGSVARARLSREVQADRLAPRGLVSSDGYSFAINLVLEQGAERFYDGILARVRAEMVGPVRWASGVPIFRTEADARTRSELLTFVPLTVLLVGVLIFAAFGSARPVVVCLSVAGAGCWITAGVMGALGVPVTIATVLLPSILLALGSAYSMHVLSAGAGKDGVRLESALGRVALPVALSGLTTAIGFTGISVVHIDAIRDIGAYGALGVLLVLGGTLTGVPALMGIWPIPYRENRLRSWLGQEGPAVLCNLAVRRGPLLLAAWTIALVLVGIGIRQVRIETDVIEWFPRGDPIRRSYEEIRSRLSGISPMNVVVQAPPGGKVVSAEIMGAVDRLATELEALPEVGKVVSIADPLRQLHGGFLGDSKNPLPTREDLIEQYLLLLDSKPYTRDLITSDRSAANIMMRIDDNGSDALLRVGREVRKRWSRFGPAGTEARATGIMYEFGRAEDEIARGQLRGLAIAVGAIGLVLLGIFRDFRLAVLALIPNAVPIAMAFGAMGLLGIPLDAGTVILGSLALGIAVDDTVHVTEAFVLARSQGCSPEKAMARSLGQVLEPVVYTSLIVATGFAVLGLSGFSLTRNLGLLTSGVMLLCLATDLLLLPALLVRFGGERPRKKAA